MAEHQIAVIGIKPDLGGDDPIEGADGADYDKQLDDAFEAAKDDDKAGWKAAMRAAIKACIAESEGVEEPKEDEEY